MTAAMFYSQQCFYAAPQKGKELPASISCAVFSSCFHKPWKWGSCRLSTENRTEAGSSQAACRAAASYLPPPALPAGRCAAASFFTPAPGVFFFSSSTLVLPSSFLARWAFALSSALTRPEERRDAYSACDLIPSDQSAFSRDPSEKTGQTGIPDTRSHKVSSHKGSVHSRHDGCRPLPVLLAAGEVRKGQQEREGDQGRGTPWAAGTILKLPAKQRGWEVMG